MGLASVSLALAAACVPGEVEPVPGQTQRVVLDGSRLAALSTASIDRVDLTISGPGMAAPVSAELGRTTGSAWTASVTSIPAGPARIFEALAFDASGTLLYQGQTVSDVLAGSTLQLVVILQDPPPPPAPGVPLVSSVEVSPGLVAPSSPVDLRVVAAGSSPSDLLSFAWGATCQNSTEQGTFLDGGGASTRWIAPDVQPLNCTLSVRVGGQQGSSVTVYVGVQVSS
ncbi:MAG TPA: hypothetical protein VLT82_09955 [Myxococcaceae bacterium]|nr:hypothetical protein [Myxococcaceae bacterium]